MICPAYCTILECIIKIKLIKVITNYKKTCFVILTIESQSTVILNVMLYPKYLSGEMYIQVEDWI